MAQKKKIKSAKAKPAKKAPAKKATKSKDTKYVYDAMGNRGKIREKIFTFVFQ